MSNKLSSIIKSSILSVAILLTGGAWADFAKTNPVTGATENYTYKFVGETTWNGTGYWQNSSGANPSGVPGKQGESTFDPFLFDGNTIVINAGMAVDGWTLRMGLYNGAYVSMNNLQKFQGGTMWVTVDETSKVRINNVNDKYEGDALNLYSAREAGIEWTCALSGAQGTGLPFNYYLKGNGSVAFTTITAANCSHTIKQADVTLHGTTATGKGKRVNSKTLVSFTSSTQSFLADATIKVKYANGASCKDVALSSVTATTPTLTTAGDIGDCELVQTSTGIVLYYVDYVYTPSISLNFTDSSANLTTENDVGLAGYTAPGTAWNNIAAAVGTTSSTIKMIDATGTATVNSGISVQIATTRGSWYCSSLTAATDPRQGYIDEDNSNTTPTITVSGIPFSNYRVIVYHSTDNGDVKFGYDTINGTNLTYVDGALTTGTTAWGDTGDQNTSHPMEEGVNTLVSGVLSGSTATIVAHRGSGFRGCIAAVQIVEAATTSLEETGGYAADASLIVFKNTTLAELTGDTLSARFGGDWAGAVKTRKMTFNNFDRSAEASGTITCEAQVQHDSNVKGVLLTFTQVGDDVAVKTTGAKYLAGTVGTSVATGTDASGHYAAYNFALPRTPQTEATIVWETGEFNMTKVGPDGNAYSFSSFGGLSVNGDGNLVINTDNALGAVINLPDATKGAATILVKYSNLTANSSGNATLGNFKVYQSDGTTVHYVGARTSTKGTLPLTPYYDSAVSAVNVGSTPSMQTGSGYYLLSYKNSQGTHIYSGSALDALTGGYSNGLKWGSSTISSVSIGGSFNNGVAYCWKGSGTVIERVAIFLGEAYTPADLADYYFPSAVAKSYEKWEYAKGMVTWNTTANSNNELAGSNSQYTLFDLQSGVDTSTTYGGTSSYQIFDSTKSATFWNYFSNGSVSDGVYQAPGVALRFAGTSATKTIGGTFGPVTLGGMYVERGAEGYSFQQAGHSRRSTILGSANSADETWFKFEEPFEVRRTGTLCLSGNINIELPEATDVLTLNANADNGNANYAPNVVATVTGLSNDGNIYIGTHTTAGGTLRMHGAGHIAAAKLVASGATLDFSDIASRYNDTTPFINCPLTIDGDTKFVFPEDIVLPYTYKVATSITYTGTPAAEYTDDNGNVYTLPLTIDTANGTVTVPTLASVTVITVNGALTISAATTADIVVNSTGTLTLATGGSLSGTVTGSGTIVCNQGVDLSGSGFDDSTNWTGKVQLTGDAVPTTDFNETVYGNANSTLEVVSGHVYMTAVTSLPGTVNVANGATLYVANTGLTSLSISGTNSGTINLQTATSLATLTLSDGIARGSLAYPNSLKTLNVALTETIADDGEASFSCGSATLTSGTLTLTRASGTTETPISGTIDGATVSFAWTPAVSGKACWIDYEMEYESGNASKTGFENSGTDTAALHSDSGITGANAFNEDTGMLYTYAHPYKNDMTGDKAFPDTWTAVVRCTVPNYTDAAVITFGWNTGFIGLIAGETPNSEMRVVQSTGGNHYVTNAVMTVQNATKAQHVYIFTVETNQSVTVYCDESLITNVVYEAPFTIATSGNQGGFQIGSILGGKTGGVVRFAKDESPANTLDETVQKDARIDCVRLYKGVLGPNAIHQLSQEFPAVKLFEATIDGGDDNQWATLGWTGGDIATLNSSSKIILTVTEDATLTLPSEIVAEEFVINITAGKTLTLNKAAGGTTFTTTEPIEVNAGSIYLANETSLGDWQISGTGTVRLPDGVEITGALTGAATITVVSGDVVTVTSTGSIANTVVGDGRIVFEGALPTSSTLLTSLQDENNWTGTVEIKDFTQPTSTDFGIIKFYEYGNVNSAIALNGVKSLMFAGANNYEHVTLREIEIGEGGWSDRDNDDGSVAFTTSPQYTANLTGSGTITVKTGYDGTVKFIGNHTFNGSVAFGANTGKQVAFMQTAEDAIPAVTAKAIVVAAGVGMSVASGKTWTAPGGIVVNGTLTPTDSTSTLSGTVTGSGRIVCEGFLPSYTGLTASAWTGTVELKNYTQTTEIDAHKIINLGNYGNSSSTVALNGVTSTMYTGNNSYPDVTLGAIEIGEGGWSDNDGLSYTVSPLYAANLTGSGTITVKTGNEGTVRFVGNHTFDGSVAFGANTGKQVAFMKTSSDSLPSVTAKAIVVAGRSNMSIASGKTWTAPGGVKIDGSLTVLTAEAATATSVTPSAYRDGAQIETSVNAEAGTTTYSTGMVVSDNQASMGAVTVIGGQSISGSGGTYMSSLTINDGATLTYDPVITPIRVESAPVFNGTGKFKLAPRYAGVTCGKFHLVSYPSAQSVSGTLHDLVDSSSFNNATYTVTEETVGSYKQLVLKVGDYDNDAKEMSIAQFGDSITEGIWRSGYRGTPNYRIPLMQLLEAYGYKPTARGYRKVGSTDANGVPADSAYEYHTGISAQRIYTGLTSGSLRAGFMESIEAHLEQVGVTDIITLKIGTNDSIGGETADNMFEGWSNLVWKIVRMRPTSKIVVCAPVKIRSGENNAPGLRTKIAEYVAKTAAQGGFPDGQVTMINGIDIVTDDANYYLTDNVHPNWNGHLQLANAWLPAVTNAFESMTNRAADTDTYTAQPAVDSAEDVDDLEAYRAGYVKLATFTGYNTKTNAWDETPYAWVNDNFKNVKMSRVAYFVARKTTASPDTRYVWVDMDTNEATGTTLAYFGVPTNAMVNCVVTNLHICSNSSAIENVAPTVSGVKGTLMLTEKGVSKADGISTVLAPTGPYGFDWNDSIYAEGAWGVMNVARIFDGATPTNHRKLLAAQMLFDFNGFNGTRQNALGIGDFAVHGPYNTANGSVDNFNLNWTFTTDKDEMPTMDARALESGVIEIWGLVDAIPGDEGADAGYIDGTTAVITNTTETVTIPASATAVAAQPTTSAFVIVATATQLSTPNFLTITAKYGASGTQDITSAFDSQVIGGDPSAAQIRMTLTGSQTVTVSGNDISVSPQVAASSPMTLDDTVGGDTEASFTIKTIPGLYYAVQTGAFNGSGVWVPSGYGDAVQATSDSTSVTAPEFEGTVQYYKIAVGLAADEVSPTL